MKQETRFTGTWMVEIRIEPGSVPGRTNRYGRGTRYRPGWLFAEFRAVARHGDPGALVLENGGGVLRGARDDIRLIGLAVSGHRLKNDSTPGQAVHSEKLYTGNLDDVPDWAADAVRTTLATLKGETPS